MQTHYAPVPTPSISSLVPPVAFDPRQMAQNPMFGSIRIHNFYQQFKENPAFKAMAAIPETIPNPEFGRPKWMNNPHFDASNPDTKEPPQILNPAYVENAPPTIPNPAFKREPEFIVEDWVAWSRIGSDDRNIIHENVKRVFKVRPLSEAGANPAIRIAAAKADFIRIHYENWKAGESASEFGLPLTAWPGVTRELAEVLKMKGIHTVENLSALAEEHFERFGIPGLREAVQRARIFLGSSEQRAVAAKLEAAEAATKAQAAQIDDLAGMVAQLLERDKAREEELQALKAEKASKKAS